MIRRFFVAAVLCFAVVPGAHSSTPLRAFLDQVDTLAAGFRQVQRDEAGRELHVTEGVVWLARPEAGAPGTGRFRWEYQSPYRQFLVCDGRRIWLYDPDLAQVTVRDAATALAGTPAELLAQRGLLEQQYSVESVVGSAGRRVRLLPKVEMGDFRSIELGLRDNGTPDQLSFEDALGGTTTIEFRDVHVNQAMDPSHFTFVAPEGTDVVAEPGAGGP